MIADIGLNFAGSPCWVASGFELHLHGCIGGYYCCTDSGARNILKADLSVKKQKDIYILNTTYTASAPCHM